MPPSFAVLEQRLRGRSKDSEQAIQRRLQVARDEVAAFAEYDFVVVNDEHCRRRRSSAQHRRRRAGPVWQRMRADGRNI